jgi:hypothetical protein
MSYISVTREDQFTSSLDIIYSQMKVKSCDVTL